jgi:nucleoside-diphosphate-sugar epimerase
MSVLVTGNQGYVGAVLGEYLNSQGIPTKGIDSGFYKECTLDAEYRDIPTKVKDIRDLTIEDFEEFEAVVHLAALSNDPIGELDSSLTYAINRDSAIKAAELARAAGVKRFIFVSTQSIYGVSTSDTELSESDLKDPQTAYAKSKWDAEQVILGMATPLFTPVALRPSTVFGWSPRLRSDIVFNNLLLSGFTKGRIEVHSDGKPWRPIIHVTDLCEAIRLSLVAKTKVVSGEAFNIGKIGGNYTVREIAQAAAECLGNVEVVFNTENITDSRTYKISFEKAKQTLGFEAKRDLVESGLEMLEKFNLLGIEKTELMGRLTNRLAEIGQLRKGNKLDDQLRFC